MNKNFFEKELSASKDSIIDKIFDSRAEELAQEKEHYQTKNTERFLDVVINVEDKKLKEQLRNIYLREDDEAGEECARLIKKYYENGFVDGLKLIVECVSGGNEK